LTILDLYGIIRVYEQAYIRPGERGIAPAVRALTASGWKDRSHFPRFPEDDRTQTRPGDPGKRLQTRETRQSRNDHSQICPVFHWALLQAHTTDHEEPQSTGNHVSHYNVLEGKVVYELARP